MCQGQKRGEREGPVEWWGPVMGAGIHTAPTFGEKAAQEVSYSGT